MASRDASHTNTRHPLSNEELQLMHAWWCACNYLSVGMI